LFVCSFVCLRKADQRFQVILIYWYNKNSDALFDTDSWILSLETHYSDTLDNDSMLLFVCRSASNQNDQLKLAHDKLAICVSQ
jgi:hypothetical protein